MTAIETRKLKFPPNETAAMQDLVDSPPRAPSLAMVDVPGAAEHLHVFVVNFDGTCNDKDHPPDNEVPTLIGRLGDHFKACQSNHFDSIYLPGVDTKLSLEQRGHKGIAQRRLDGSMSVVGLVADALHFADAKISEGALGLGVVDRAITAIQAFEQFVANARKVDPKAHFHVHINAFSRGCSSALLLANMLQRFDAEQPPYANKGEGKVVRSSGVLLDPVTTGVGSWTSILVEAIKVGIELGPDNLPLAWHGRVKPEDQMLPSNAAAFCALRTNGEERDSFKSHNPDDVLRKDDLACARGAYMEGAGQSSDHSVIYKRLTNLKIPLASHGDMASCYPGATITKVTEYVACTFMQSLGLPIRGRKPSAADMTDLTATHWGPSEMLDSIVPGVRALRQLRGAVPETEMSPTEVQAKLGKQRKDSGKQIAHLEGPTAQFIAQTNRIVRVDGNGVASPSGQLATPVEDVLVEQVFPNRCPTSAETADPAHKIFGTEVIQFSLSPHPAGTTDSRPWNERIQVSSGYKFNRHNQLFRDNDVQVANAPSPSDMARLIEVNGPVALIVDRQKGIPLINGCQLPGNQEAYEAKSNSAPLLAPAPLSALQKMEQLTKASAQVAAEAANSGPFPPTIGRSLLGRLFGRQAPPVLATADDKKSEFRRDPAP